MANNNADNQSATCQLTNDELRKLTDFFSLLIRIDQKQKAEQKHSANGAKNQKGAHQYAV